MIALTLGAGALWPAAVAAVAAVLFALHERRAPDPMLDLRLWAQRPIATANAATLLSGMTMIGLTAFLPMYVQGVLRQTPLVAGFTLGRRGVDARAVQLLFSTRSQNVKRLGTLGVARS